MLSQSIASSFNDVVQDMQELSGNYLNFCGDEMRFPFLWGPIVLFFPFFFDFFFSFLVFLLHKSGSLLARLGPVSFPLQFHSTFALIRRYMLSFSHMVAVPSVCEHFTPSLCASYALLAGSHFSLNESAGSLI
jgi:hypothetical protein